LIPSKRLLKVPTTAESTNSSSKLKSKGNSVALNLQSPNHLTLTRKCRIFPSTLEEN
jgi:hypothetical protein